MADVVLMTQEGYDKLEAERDELVSVRRKDVSEKLKEARSYGDLSENAEYDAAKDEQREIEERIVAIESLLKNAEVVDDAEEGTINIGCKVKLFDKEFDEEVEYMIVGSTEANSLQGKISNESPVGMALLRHRVGDEVTVEYTGELSEVDSFTGTILSVKKA